MNSDIVFEKLNSNIPEKLQLKIKGKLRFKIKRGKESKSWLIDITNNRVLVDDIEIANTTFHLTDEDMI